MSAIRVRVRSAGELVADDIAIVAARAPVVRHRLRERMLLLGRAHHSIVIGRQQQHRKLHWAPSSRARSIQHPPCYDQGLDLDLQGAGMPGGRPDNARTSCVRRPHVSQKLARCRTEGCSSEARRSPPEER
eukprot:5748831-Prymnesium_polylepis.1